MKNIIYILVLLFNINLFGQNTPINIVNICSGLTEEDVPNQTYFMDVDHTFDNFIGTWKYINGNEIVTFELTKVTQMYFPQKNIYEDYMIGNYSYSIDEGNTFVVNTITSPVIANSSMNPMYTPCTEDGNLGFVFRDVILNKGFCSATFEFLPNSTTQMNVRIRNPNGIVGSFDYEPPYNPDFTLPTDMVVTKQ